MTTEDRNYLFEEKAYLINVTMNKHRALIRACRMEADDVYQQLSIRLLNAIDKYDWTKCPNMDAYLMVQLRYELLYIKTCSNRTGVTGAPKMGFSLLSLDAMNAAGYQVQDPGYGALSNFVWLEQKILSLPAAQNRAISGLLSGKRISCNNKALKAARLRIKNQLMFCGQPQYA